MAQWVRTLVHKHKDQSSTLQCPRKRQGGAPQYTLSGVEAGALLGLLATSPALVQWKPCLRNTMQKMQ